MTPLRISFHSSEGIAFCFRPCGRNCRYDPTAAPMRWKRSEDMAVSKEDGLRCAASRGAIRGAVWGR